MIVLVKAGEVYAPEALGRKDILILNGKVESISEPGEISFAGVEIKTIDALNKIIIPGFIDSHVHILGGGGEGGPATRAPEIRIESIVNSGVTTVIGCLGTDGTTRHMQSLLAKARGLDIEGITTYIFSGSYEFPVVNLTGSIRSDLLFIDKVIGSGEIALSDHRSSQPTFDEFARLASECRAGGMLGGKAGILHCHMGAGPRKMEMIFRLINETEIPPTQVIPTHSNRNSDLLDDGIRFILKGGYIDLTAGEDPANDDHGLSIASSINKVLEKKASLDFITVSSDGNGSFPLFDQKGIFKGLTIASQKSLFANFRYLVEKKILPIHSAIKLFATNPADFYKLDSKGRIDIGKDADLLILNKNLSLNGSIIRGIPAMLSGDTLVRSTFII